MKRLTVECYDENHRWVHKGKPGEADIVAWMAFIQHLEQYHHWSLGDVISERFNRVLG